MYTLIFIRDYFIMEQDHFGYELENEQWIKSQKKQAEENIKFLEENIKSIRDRKIKKNKAEWNKLIRCFESFYNIIKSSLKVQQVESSRLIRKGREAIIDHLSHSLMMIRMLIEANNLIKDIEQNNSVDFPKKVNSFTQQCIDAMTQNSSHHCKIEYSILLGKTLIGAVLGIVVGLGLGMGLWGMLAGASIFSSLFFLISFGVEVAPMLSKYFLIAPEPLIHEASHSVHTAIPLHIFHQKCCKNREKIINSVKKIHHQASIVHAIEKSKRGEEPKKWGSTFFFNRDHRQSKPLCMNPKDINHPLEIVGREVVVCYKI